MNANMPHRIEIRQKQYQNSAITIGARYTIYIHDNDYTLEANNKLVIGNTARRIILFSCSVILS